MTLLTIENLSVRFPTGPAVESLSLSVGSGESIGLVGESGSGKTQTALAIMGLVDRSAEVRGSIRLGEDELVGANSKLLRRVRARRVAMIFQDPSAALNPYRRVGDQLADIVTWHELAHGKAAREKVLGLLEKTGLPDPSTQYRRYPHQLSGGMRQRVMIAAALVAEPDIIIADEPTTALDVTVQAQILSLLLELRRETGVSLLLITHDLGVIANASDRLLVMHDGRVIEEGPTAAVFAEPQHEQTARMLAAVRSPRRFAPDMRSGQRRPVLDLDSVSVRYPTRQGIFRRHSIVALQPLRLTLRPGETVAVVGESGSGKTSLARAVLGLVAPDTGTVSYLGSQLAPTLKARKHAERKHLTLVFQDPVASLNPAMRVELIVAEPLSVQRGDLSPAERADAVRAVLAR
ncbi:MAG: ATP-binding cassette domain-containing protein, partial [Pseudomonadota bacterium]